MRRGELWWADLPPLAGRRPVLLLSRDEAYAVRNLVLVSPVTTSVRSVPTEVQLGIEEGLPWVSVPNLDVIMTIPKTSLQEQMGLLSPEKLSAVEDAIRFALGLEHQS